MTRPHFLAFVIGAFSQTAQVLLIREFLCAANGTETVVAVGLSAWLGATALGAWAAAGLRPRSRPSGAILAGAVLLASFLLPAALGLVRCNRSVLWIPSGAYVGPGTAAALALFALAPVAFAAALAFGWVLAQPRNDGGAAEQAEAAYAWESAGALAAGVLLTFLLLDRAAPATTAFGVVVLLVAGLAAAPRPSRSPMAEVGGGRGAAVTAPRPWTSNVRLVAFPLLALAAVGVLFGPAVQDRLERRAWRDAAPGQRLVETRESHFARLAVLEYGHQRSLFANGVLLDTAPDERFLDPEAEEGDLAAPLHLALTWHPAPRRVLLVGGLHGFARAALAHPGTAVDCVDMDPAVAELWTPYLPRADREALASRRVRIVHGDARRHVRTAEAPYDVVFCAVADPVSRSLNRFFTREFFEEVRSRLAPGGLLAVRLGSMEGALPASYARRNGLVYGTLRDAFPAVLATPGTTCWLYATLPPAAIDPDPEAAVRRFRARIPEAGRFRPELFHLLLEPEAVRRVNDALAAAAPAAQFNTDDRSLACDLSQGIWSEFAMESAGSAPLWIGAAVGWALVAAGIAAARRRRPRRKTPAPVADSLRRPDAGALVVSDAFFSGCAPSGATLNIKRAEPLAIGTMAATGCASMTLFLLLVYRFQDLYGCVYHWLGLLSGCFMAGTAAGAAARQGIFHRKIAGRAATSPAGGVEAFPSCAASSVSRRFSGPLIAAEAAMAAAAVIIALLPEWAAGLPEGSWPALFSALAAVVGALTGFEFAALNGRAAGNGPALYAADALGAAAGPLLVAWVGLPLLGLTATGLAAAGLKAANLVFLLSSRSARL